LICGVVAVLACALAGACANAQGNDLIMASSNGDLPPVRALLAVGSDVNVNTKRSDGATALGVASQQGHVEAVQPMLAAQADANANPGLAQAQTPAPVNTLPSDAELDALVAAQNWGGLSTALSQAKDGEPFMRKLEWLRSRLPAGGPSLLGFDAVRATWRVGINVKEPDPNKDSRLTAGMLTLYTFELIQIDGAKCEDQSAPAHRAEQLMKIGGPALTYLRAQSDEVIAVIVDNAITLEKKTAPLRKEDDMLCRDGMAQMKAGLEKGKQHEIPTPSGQSGKTIAVEAPPDWVPAFLPPEKYKPAQDKARGDMKSTLLQLAHSPATLPLPSVSGAVAGAPGGVPDAQMGSAIGGIISSTPAVAPGDAAAQRVRIAQTVSEAMVLSRVQPDYPPLARQARIQGSVVLRATIGKDGSIESLTLVSGHPMLVPAATAAVKQWKYKPYLLHGEPVEVDTDILVNFALSGG
jgi:protein TonB